MRSALRSAQLLGVFAALVVGLFACAKTPDPNDPSQVAQQNQYGQPQPQGQYTQPQGQYTQPQGQYGQPTGQPTATAPAAAPAGGFPCQTDADPQCVFGRCQGGRCGSCASATDCKAGAACVQTPLGMTCMPGMPGAR